MEARVEMAVTPEDVQVGVLHAGNERHAQGGFPLSQRGLTAATKRSRGDAAGAETCSFR